MNVKKLIRTQYDHEWSNNYGTMHDILVWFEDGEEGVASAKSPNPWYVESAPCDVAVSYKGKASPKGIPQVKLDKPDFAQNAQKPQGGQGGYNASVGQKTPSGSSQGSSGGRFGATVGMAINNAVQMAIAKGHPDDLEIIETMAEGLIQISERREKGIPLPSSGPSAHPADVGNAQDVVGSFHSSDAESSPF